MFGWLKEWLCKKYMREINKQKKIIEDWKKKCKKKEKDYQKTILELQKIIRNREDSIRELKKQINILPSPTLKVKKPYTRISQILENYLGTRPKIYLLDINYYLPSKSDILELLKDTNVDKLKYIKDEFDCDDFAIRLWGVTSKGDWAKTTLGFACGNRHAFNIVILDDEELYIIEPQTDQLIPYNSAGSMYKPIWLVII